MQGGAEGQAAEDPLVDEPQLRAVLEVERDLEVLLQGCVRLADEHLPAHAQVREQRVAPLLVGTVQRQPQVLAAPARLDHGATRETQGEVLGTGHVTPQGSDVEHPHRDDPTADDVVGQAATDDLDLGELGHLSRRR